VPYVGTAAAIGLVLFFVCAVHTHLLAADYSAQFALAIGLLLLDAGTLTVHVMAHVGRTGAFG
jgi:hypothetical protein